jgi:hypothetical protein
VIAFQEVCFERGQRGRQQDVDHILRLKAAVHIVAEEDQDRPALVFTIAGVFPQVLQQALQQVGATVHIADGVDAAA